MKRFLGIAAILGGVAGVAYLATVGCCHLLGWGRGTVSLADSLSLSAGQREAIEPLERKFLAQKTVSCERLCAKRAQLLQLLQSEDLDRELLSRLSDEIGMEQAALERATLEHLAAVRQHLNPGQRRRLEERVSDRLRAACKATACGKTAGCPATGDSER